MVSVVIIGGCLATAKLWRLFLNQGRLYRTVDGRLISEAVDHFKRLNSEAKESKVMQEAMTHGLKDNATSRENMRKDIATSQEGMRRDLERHREMMEQHVQRINNIFNMLSSPPQFWLSPNFSPQSVVDPLLPNQGTFPMTYGLQEAEELPVL